MYPEHIAASVSQWDKMESSPPPPPMRMRRIPPLFPPELWNVHMTTMLGGSRTNICESWNNGFRSLVGHSHPTLWRAIDSIRKDKSNVDTDVLLESRGQPPKKRQRRDVKSLQSTLFNICRGPLDRSKSIEATLRGIGYCIRWK